MRSPVRTALITSLIGALLAALAPVAHAAFGVSEANFEAGTCNVNSCTYEGVEANHSEAFTQAAGHPPWGLTGFELNSKEVLFGQHEPEGVLKRVRVDVPPGLAANPEALPECELSAFEKDECDSKTEVGETKLTAFVLAADAEITGTVYNLEPPPGLPLLFGIHVEVPLVANEHIFLEGHVDWSGDYHEYFEIKNISKSIPVLKSKLLFKGTAGKGDFLTLPSECSTTTTSHLEVESWEGQISRTQTHTPIGVEHCDKVPFAPSASVKPETSASDQPDGTAAEVQVPQHEAADETNTADIKDAQVTLPEGLTLNPSAAQGLQACTAAEIAIGSTQPVTCPSASKVGTVAIETDLPPGSLQGAVYLGNPNGGAITKPPYTIYLDAESGLGVSVRLAGQVEPDSATGRLTATFTHNPPLPFSDLIMHFNGGPRAPLANPLACETGHVEAQFTPYTGGAAALSATPFVTSGCLSPLPFSLSEGTHDSSTQAGAHTSYTFNLARPDGQQYLSHVSTMLPPGLLGTIPSVALCGEPQAQTGMCSATSQIGTANASVGAGTEPISFSGPVFLTGPYGDAPFGLSIPIAAVAGPFDLGPVVTRASVGVDPYSGRVIVTSAIPTIVGGVPLRLRSLSVAIERLDFLLNPTSCAPLSTDSTLGSTLGATQNNLSSPFQVGNCGALAFKPSFVVSTGAKTSRANGASLQVHVTQGAGQANMRSVLAQLPKQLPARLTTLQKACPEATFAASPFSCPGGSKVGTATVTTPVLPGSLSGPAYLVSHGGAAFPDLALVLEGSGVRVILIGNTNIKQGVTSSTFTAIPDVPVSSFALDLPAGPNSALAANGSLCAQSLVMPTTITAQSGAQIRQNTRIAVSGCPVMILGRRVVGHALVLEVKAFAAGRISARGKNLRTIFRRLGKASTITLKVGLSRAGLEALRRHRRLKLRVRVGFVPELRSESSSAASATVVFRR
ncbi:MAG TPA: hypothetical protein VES65_05590 [Solirubrobacteraceae bacterium]|nr:hypothetical protein [Solirubrobacteraceae bacterium]